MLKRMTLLATAGSALVLAAFGLGACDKAAGTQPATGAPIASLPLATAAPPEQSAAPLPQQLPQAPPIPRAAKPRRPVYSYVDAAYALNDAFADSPPDYSVTYQGAAPWVWRSEGGEYRVVEDTSDGERIYYYRGDSDEPFYVRDPRYGYAYDGGALVGVYDSYGRPYPNYAQSLLVIAAQYLTRGRGLHNAAIHDQRRAAYAADWRARRDDMRVYQERWREERDRNAEWRQVHDDRAQQDQQRFARFQQERAQREAYAQQVAPVINAAPMPQRPRPPGPFSEARPGFPAPNGAPNGAPQAPPLVAPQGPPQRPGFGPGDRFAGSRGPVQVPGRQPDMTRQPDLTRQQQIQADTAARVQAEAAQRGQAEALRRQAELAKQAQAQHPPGPPPVAQESAPQQQSGRPLVDPRALDRSAFDAQQRAQAEAARQRQQQQLQARDRAQQVQGEAANHAREEAARQAQVQVQAQMAQQRAQADQQRQQAQAQAQAQQQQQRAAEAAQRQAQAQLRAQAEQQQRQQAQAQQQQQQHAAEAAQRQAQEAAQRAAKAAEQHPPHPQPAPKPEGGGGHPQDQGKEQPK